MITHRKLSEMKNKILPTCLQENCGDSLGEFLNTSYGEVEAERVKLLAIFSFFLSLHNILTGTLDGSLSLFALFVIRLVTVSNLLTLM